jgi:hypothetical protein
MIDELKEYSGEKMNITPGISVAICSGLGYIMGKCIETNAKQVALIWMVAEVTRQVFVYLNDRWDWGFSKPFLIYISFGLACGCAHQMGLINKLSQPILFSGGLSLSLCFLEECLGDTKIMLYFPWSARGY